VRGGLKKGVNVAAHPRHQLYASAPPGHGGSVLYVERYSMLGIAGSISVIYTYIGYKQTYIHSQVYK